MAETWKQLADAWRDSAVTLVGDDPRSCVSRAYNAAYARVTHDLARLPNVTFPAGREGPSHPGMLPQQGTGANDSGIRRLIVNLMGHFSVD